MNIFIMGKAENTIIISLTGWSQRDFKFNYVGLYVIIIVIVIHTYRTMIVKENWRNKQYK